MTEWHGVIFLPESSPFYSCVWPTTYLHSAWSMPTQGRMAEWSKALVLGTSPKGCGFESHCCQMFYREMRSILARFWCQFFPQNNARSVARSAYLRLAIMCNANDDRTSRGRLQWSFWRETKKKTRWWNHIRCNDEIVLLIVSVRSNKASVGACPVASPSVV